MCVQHPVDTLALAGAAHVLLDWGSAGHMGSVGCGCTRHGRWLIKPSGFEENLRLAIPDI